MTNQIAIYFQENNLSSLIDLPAVISQINKDISQSGGDFMIDPKVSLDNAFTLLCNKTQEWLTTNEVDLQALLYRIDVSERDIKRDQLTPKRVTELIFKREIIKIRFRKEYSA